MTAPADHADMLVKDAELVVTMSGDEVAGGWVAIRDGFVTGIGIAGDEPEATEQLSARGCLVTPGLINTHHHIHQNLMRSYAPVANSDWMTWRAGLGPSWARLDEEASYVSAWIGMAELALGGCTTTSDHMFLHPHPRLIDGEVAAAGEVGMRLHAARGGMDVRHETNGYREAALFESPDGILEDCERLVGRYHQRSPGAMVQIALAPCSLLDSSPEVIRAAADLAERLDVRLHMHLATGPPEAEYCLARFGRRPLDHFAELGWGGDRTWVAHCNAVEPGEIARLARWGTGVAHCPSSNMLLGLGAAPVGAMLRAGVNVGLGCDGSAAADHASLWLEARSALLLARMIEGAATHERRIGARDVLAIATVGSATCLGRAGELGVLAPGACGDLVAWPLEGVRFAGAWSDPVEAWLRCGPLSARHTVCAGVALVRDGELCLPGLDEMLTRHARISRQWHAEAAA
jgi:cytosine/adenosine deaminase-related metal-dependent hydrolase